MDRRRVHSAVLMAAFCAAGLPAQRSERIVDPRGGAGSHYTTLQAAADAAAPGDVLRLALGDVGPLDTSKPLVVLGTPTVGLAPGSQAGAVTVRDLPAGSEFVLADVGLMHLSLQRAAFTAVGCSGRVVVQRSRHVQLGYPVLPLFRYQVADCREVVLSQCESFSHRGLIALRSTVHLDRCRFEMGPLEVLWCNGFSAVDVDTCDVWSMGSTFRGSEASCVPGYGLRAIGGTLHLAGTAAHPTSLSSYGGANGLYTVATTIVRSGDHVAISGRQGHGTLVVRPLPVVTVAAGTARGGVAEATMESVPGGVAALGFWRATTPVQVAAGELGVDLAAPCNLVLAPAGAPLTTRVPVPASAQLIGATFAAQGVTLDAGGRDTLSNRALIVLP